MKTQYEKMLDIIHEAETLKELNRIPHEIMDETKAGRIKAHEGDNLIGAIDYRRKYILPVVIALKEANQDNPTIINQSILSALTKKV